MSSIGITRGSDFTNCNRGINIDRAVCIEYSNSFINVNRNVYRISNGINLAETQTYKRWSSGNYTGVAKEFVFAKLTQTGVYRVVIMAIGMNIVGAYS